MAWSNSDSRSPPFNLVRFFFLLSLIIMTVATFSMASYLRHYSSAQLLKLEKARASSLVQVFENSLWSQFKPLMQADLNAEQLRKMAQDGNLFNNVVHLMRGTDVIKLKVYALNGLTLFSTDPKQIGEIEENNDGFKSAVANHAVSELAHKDSFDSFERVLVDRDVISTYVPVHGTNETVEGVLELYVDATPFVSAMAEQLAWLAISICLLMLALFVTQMLVVMHAGRIIRQQAAALVSANRDLDRRVEERTHELGQANQQLTSEILERRNAEERLDQLAHHDPLTQLANRLFFNERLAQLLAPEQAQPLALLFIDLDRFKDVNDTLGHFIGDQLLVAVSERLVTQIAPSDTLARLGGDEFVCILNSLDLLEHAEQVAAQLLTLFHLPFKIHGNDIYLSASIGISFAPEDGQDVDTLVRHADIAMYQAKADGRNRFQRYTHAMSAAAEERVRIERYLRQAIELKELEVHFQAKVDSTHRQLVGAEALARWNSPVLGAIAPARFIPVAEDSGLIVALGDLILEKTCQQLRDWRSHGFNIPCVSVNLSVKQLERDDFPLRLTQLLQTYSLPASVLELEITESVIMAVDNAIETLNAIRALGIKLSIDDFGTGYSSLAYLKQLPVQVLKIDRAFILKIGEGKDNEAIIRTIIALAASLGLSTVAEGVEEQAQIDFLQREGCTTIQGFYYSQPMSATAFAQQWQQHVLA